MKGPRMATCEVCRNDYHLSFEVTIADRTHVFDCFECAIQRLAPVCQRCRCRIMGHGVEAHGTLYFCASCARQEGVDEVIEHSWGLQERALQAGVLKGNVLSH